MFGWYFRVSTLDGPRYVLSLLPLDAVMWIRSTPSPVVWAAGTCWNLMKARECHSRQTTRHDEVDPQISAHHLCLAETKGVWNAGSFNRFSSSYALEQGNNCTRTTTITTVIRPPLFRRSTTVILFPAVCSVHGGTWCDKMLGAYR